MAGSNPADELRRYLEQRRETGERDLVLDHLSVDEVMRLVGAPAAARSATNSPSKPASSPAPSTSETSHASADWREVLRTAGASPEKVTERPEGREAAASTGAEVQVPS